MINKKGFTLIEVIATLVLVGIITSVGGIFVVQVVQGYLLTQESSEISGKARLALKRIKTELEHAKQITTVASPDFTSFTNNGCIIYTRLEGETGAIFNTAQSGQGYNAPPISLQIGTSASLTTNILLEDAVVSLYAISGDLKTTVINVSITIQKPGSRLNGAVFSTIVYPRNRK